MTETQRRIVEHLKIKGPTTARAIADALSVDKKVVNSQLYGALASKVEQDAAYRWSLRGTVKRAEQSATVVDTPLGRLCRYYLECLGHELPGVSVFASSRYDLDYQVLASSSDLTEAVDISGSRVAARARQETGKVLYVGYPTLIVQRASRKGSWRGNFVEPLALIPVIAPGMAGGSEMIILNQKAVQSISRAADAMVLQEIVELSSELGLAGAPGLDELARRLQLIRAEWPWREPVDPDALKSRALGDDTPEGLYNTAVLIMGERSPYTVGLETELAQLSRVSESRSAGTALSHWLSPEYPAAATGSAPTRQLIEPVPLNDEQRTAVHRALDEKLTVITGPPGTGKSQVVSAILTNAAYRGLNVLFASKNNKAVDVVERRVNELGSRPLLIRLGRPEHRDALISFLSSFLAARPTAESQSRLENALQRLTSAQARADLIRRRSAEFVELRNQVDRTEQSVEELRNLYGPDAFGLWLHSEPEALISDVEALTATVQRAKKTSLPKMLRVLWPLVRRRRFRELSALSEGIASVFNRLMISPPREPITDGDTETWSTFVDSVGERTRALTRVREYGVALARLGQLPSPEELAANAREAADLSLESSRELWNEWLRVQPQKMSTERRRTLGDLLSALELGVNSDQDESDTAREFRRLQKNLFAARDVLPCWAVTSLAARGRLPLEGAIFDLVVIDEASQCDIASALPLLFRARRAVIIGDPKQLRHIAALREHQDRSLLAKHRFLDSRLSWSYSTRSVFDLAMTLVRNEDIVDLLDHHRSHDDIIAFANRTFYEERLRVATRYDRLKTPTPDAPAVRWSPVSGDVRRPAEGGAVNMVEAQAVVAELRKLLVDQGYRGTVGVVTPFRAQEKAINDLAMSDPDIMQRATGADLLIDTVHKFQGDERDVMFLSPVISRDTPPGALMFLKRNVNLFNVAITRARASLVIVGDRNACATSEVSYLERLVLHVADIERRSQRSWSAPADAGRAYPVVDQPDLVSEWERVLYGALYDAGLRPVPQYPVEKFRLDLALFQDQRKLDIEVDGERYHRQWDGELMRRDVLRNQRMYELGWDVMRFWVYQVRDDLEECVRKVRHWYDVNSAH